MTLYETISRRRQVREFHREKLSPRTIESIMAFVQSTDQLFGQWTNVKLASAEEMNGGTAPHYLLGYCGADSEAYANVGYTLQAADLYIQSMGLGSGWFMNAKPKIDTDSFCIALAFGGTDMLMRGGPDEFKRMPIERIGPDDGIVSQAVRLAPSSLNSQPWKLEFENRRVLVRDAGKGVKRIILKNKLNKIDVGIAARHAVLALEQEGKKIEMVIPQTQESDFFIEIDFT